MLDAVSDHNDESVSRLCKLQDLKIAFMSSKPDNSVIYENRIL